MSANVGRSDSSEGQEERLHEAIRQDRLDTVQDIFAGANQSIIANIGVLVSVAASMGHKDILIFLLDQLEKNVHANGQKHLMPEILMRGKRESLLCAVAKHGMGSIAVMLFDRFAVKPQELVAALTWLARHQKSDAIQTIIAKLCDAGEEPMCKKPRLGDVKDVSLVDGMLKTLHAAAAAGHAAVVEQLINASEFLVGGSLDLSSALHLACKHGHIEVMHVLLQNQCGTARIGAATIDAVVLAAAGAGHAEAARLALFARPQLHALHDLLVILAEAKHTDAVFCILKELKVGVDLASSTKGGGSGEAGATGAEGTAAEAIKRALAVALAEAAGKGRAAVAKLLLGANADVNAMQGLPLRRAVACGCDATVELLLCGGACVRVLKDEPLRAAARARHSSTVLMLTAKGADVTVLTDDMVADGAARGEMEWVLLLLRLNGALDRQAALSCVCKEAIKGGSSCRTRLVQEVKDCMAKSCSRAEARLDELTYLHHIHPEHEGDGEVDVLHEPMAQANVPHPGHGLEQPEHRIIVSCRDGLTRMFAALRRELHLAEKHDVRPSSRFDAAIVQCVDAALQLANDTVAAGGAVQHHHADAIMRVLNDGVRAALIIAFRGEDFESDLDLAKARDCLFPASDRLGQNLLSQCAPLLLKKQEAFSAAFQLIGNGAIPLEENVKDLVCAASQLASPSEHLPQISMLFDVFGAGVNFAISAGLRQDVLLRCVLSRVLLEGTGIMGAWAWHYLRQRRRFENLLEMYEEVTMRVGNQGYMQAMRNFYEVAHKLELQQQHSAQLYA